MNNRKLHNDSTKKIAHIGIAVQNLDLALPFYTDILKLELEAIESVQSENVKVAFLKIGDTHLELLEPLDESSPIQSFINKRGEGIHHIALEVDSVSKRLKDMRENGIKLINEEPKSGAGGAQIAFLHPKSTNGVLYELCEYKKGDE